MASVQKQLLISDYFKRRNVSQVDQDTTKKPKTDEDQCVQPQNESIISVELNPDSLDLLSVTFHEEDHKLSTWCRKQLPEQGRNPQLLSRFRAILTQILFDDEYVGLFDDNDAKSIELLTILPGPTQELFLRLLKKNITNSMILDAKNDADWQSLVANGFIEDGK